MRKSILIIHFFVFTINMFSQGDEYYGNYQHYYEQSEVIENPTIQPPDVAAFQKVNFIPVNNYTGRAEITIPIFTVKSGNISIPISLSYNSGGVKVNDIPSSVGSNWSLNAGGVVSKVVRGMEDFARYGSLSDFNFDTWSFHARYTHTIATDAPYNPQGQIGTGGDVFELTGQQNKIEETIAETNIQGSFIIWQQASGSNDRLYYDGAFQPFSTYTNQIDRPKPSMLFVNAIKVTSLSGLEYNFNDFDVSQYSFEQQERNVSFGNYHPIETKSKLKVESYNLSSIKDIKSNKEVHFEYEQYYKSSYDPIDDNFFYYGNISPYYMDALIDAKSVKYPQLHRLNKITYDKGSVEFIYGLNRLDVTDEKALTQIIIKDINGNIIKKFSLDYSYMQNTSLPSSPQNKRLRLDEVYTTNSLGNTLPEYKLTYNTTSLPARGTWGQDFLGYNNGSYSSSNSNPKPSIYFYPDSGINSILPISKGSGYYLLSGNYSLVSNLIYAKAGILEKIEYPTGGFSEFEYELNQFKIDNTTITGGGLRIKTQKIIDENNNQQLLDYVYTDTSNQSSGSIISFSNYVDFKVINAYNPPISPTATLNYFSFKTYRLSQAQAELTKGSFVGYSRVVVKDRVSNGYTEYNYSSPNDFPNQLPPRTGLSNTTATAIRNGQHNYIINNEVYRGNLLSKKIFNNSNTLLFKQENLYQYKKFSSIDYDHVAQLSNASSCYGSHGEYTGPEMTETVSIPAERYIFSQSIKTNYLEGGNTSVTNQVTYDTIYPLVIENTIIDNQKTVLNKYYYPHNSQVSSNSYMSNLRSQNRYSEMIKQEAYSDNEKIFTEVINYHDFGNNIYLPKSVSTAKATNTIEEGAIIDKRDEYGNILQYHTKDNIYTSFIYGYNYSSLVAKIDNATYDASKALLPVTITQLQALDSQNDEATLIGYFNTVRNSLPNAKVSSYTYLPSIGVSTITDTRGKTISYEYDEFNRLQQVKDATGKILSHNEYHYKDQ